MDDSSTGTVTDSSIIESALQNPTPNTPLADVADAKFDESESSKESEKTEETPEKGKQVEIPETKEPVKEDIVAETVPEDEGYYADEGLEDVETKDLETSKGQTEMGQWVLDNLPDIPIAGIRNGKPVTLEVKRAEDLPVDFEFNNKRDEKIFDQSIADQTNRAYRLIDQYQQNQQQAQVTQFSQQEDRDIQSDIADLQRSGELGKFKYQPNDPKFESDPSVKEMQSILDFYNEQNLARYEASQKTGRIFNRISYRDAFQLYRVDHPETSPEQKKEDTSRKAASKTIAKAGNGTEATSGRPKLRRNAGIDEIINAYGL